MFEKKIFSQKNTRGRRVIGGQSEKISPRRREDHEIGLSDEKMGPSDLKQSPPNELTHKDGLRKGGKGRESTLYARGRERIKKEKLLASLWGKNVVTVSGARQGKGSPGQIREKRRRGDRRRKGWMWQGCCS